jgi:hypothetical protein
MGCIVLPLTDSTKKIEVYMARVEELKGLPAPVASKASNSAQSMQPKPVASAPAPEEFDLPQVPSGAPSRARGNSQASPGRGAGGGGGALPIEKTVSIKQDSTGHPYRSLFRDYLVGAVRISVEDPYLKTPHQMRNLLRLLELIVEVNDCYEVEVITRPDSAGDQHSALQEMQRSLQEMAGIKLSWKFSDSLHDRCLRLSNGWRIVLGRGLDFYQKPPEGCGKYFLGAYDQGLRKCLECDIIFLKDK